jgi:bifunctional DNA-binding transcriptional regulator/antitoxin component of YhaV-PrlF toxin-antitoxin module
VITGEDMMEVEVKRVDSQGRVALPADWRREVLEDNKEVVLLREGDLIVIKARRKPDLTLLFDTLETDLSPESFRDWETLKRALLEDPH